MRRNAPDRMDDRRVRELTFKFVRATRRVATPYHEALVKVDYFGRSVSHREVVVRSSPVDTSAASESEMFRARRRNRKILRPLIAE